MIRQRLPASRLHARIKEKGRSSSRSNSRCLYRHDEDGGDKSVGSAPSARSTQSNRLRHSSSRQHCDHNESFGGDY